MLVGIWMMLETVIDQFQKLVIAFKKYNTKDSNDQCVDVMRYVLCEYHSENVVGRRASV